MKTFLIMTEDKNRTEVKDILARLDGYTLYYGEGYWKGEFLPSRIYRENNLTIMIVTNKEELVKEIAREIKELNKQESVLVLSFETEMELI